MANGHAAGMQTGKEFGERERRLKKEKEDEMKRYDKDQSGLNAETTYRDKGGKKVDMLNQFLRKEAIEEGKKAQIEEAQLEWGKSRVQKELEIEKLQDIVDIAAGPFARTVDDPKLERERKNAIREGDPMYEHFMALQHQEEDRQREEFNKEQEIIEPHEQGHAATASVWQQQQQQQQRKKPRYNGPNIAMNRFTHSDGPRSRPVLPGYRWDGIDRSNGLERKILIKMNEKNEFREDEYKWSVADM